ncbi:MAG: bifunctional oligoribonuclease/PAP phosphatase NrnA [Paludibacteraceae bacterium]|nr:bifunctional oligoribonuclease/PAP phosphatase NrnA [Paludibacteraceae bacterium]
MQNLIDNQLVNAAGQLIANAHRVAVITHLSPDGDAMGSSLGMKHFLLSQGKEVEVVVPNDFPNFLSWLPGAKEDKVCDKDAEQALQILNNADLVIVTDFQEPKRCGEVLGDWLAQNTQSTTHRPVIMIDHHLYPSDMADVTISYPDCASASELVYRLIRQLKVNDATWQMNRELATCIYTGMMTDTGNFQYNSNHPDMYEIVAELMRAGVNKDDCYDKVFNQFHTGRLRLVGYCLYRKMRTFPKNHVALIALSAEELKQFNFQSGDAEGIVNMPMQIGKIYYSCFMREDTDKIKISFRSQGDRPVNTFAHDFFNGGGHKNAAGGEFYGSLQDAVKTFMEHYEEYCH